MSQTALLLDENNWPSLPMSIQEMLDYAREIRLNEQQILREVLQQKQREIDALHVDLFQTKEELMAFKQKSWR